MYSITHHSESQEPLPTWVKPLLYTPFLIVQQETLNLRIKAAFICPVFTYILDQMRYYQTAQTFNI